MKPVTQSAPLTVPWWLLPEESEARIPAVSSSFQCATTPGVGVGLGVGVGVGDGVGVGTITFGVPAS